MEEEKGSRSQSEESKEAKAAGMLNEDELKKQKSRQSTQLSRQRRKLYEELLEKTYNSLNQQYKQEIQKLNLNNSLSDKMKKYISFLRQKKVIESKMEDSTSREALDNEVIGKILMDGILYRLGPKGHTRESLCNLLISMIIDEIFPEPYKFVFCLIHSEILKNNFDKKEVMMITSLMNEDQQDLLRNQFGEQISALKTRYDAAINNLCGIRDRILEDQKEIESLLHQSANVVSSTKRSNYVNFIEFSILGTDKINEYFEEFKEEDLLKKRRVETETPVPNSKFLDMESMMDSGLKEKKLKVQDKRSEKTVVQKKEDGETDPNGGDLKESYLDFFGRFAYAEKQSTEGMGSGLDDAETSFFSFSDPLFDQFYNVGKEDLSHLFLDKPTEGKERNKH